MNILKALLLYLFPPKQAEVGVDKLPGVFPGVLLDERPAEAKEADVTFGELVAKADPVDWKERPESEWRTFGDQDQNGQSSCVANAGRKAFRIQFRVGHKLEVDPSSLDIYRRRANFPKGGMNAWDLWDVLAAGVTLNALLPSDGFSESYANNIKVAPWMRTVGDVFKITRGVNITDYANIDAVASVTQRTGKGVVLFYYFTEAEWSRKDPRILIPNLPLQSASATLLRHAVCEADFTLINGVKHLVIEDSAHFGGITRRVISESFHKARCFYAGYPMNFSFDPAETVKPSHTFGRDIPFGETSDEVKILQQCLAFERVFPSNVSASGYYGSVTAAAVLAFQKKYAVADLGTLEQLAGRNVGSRTREALNRIFA